MESNPVSSLRRNGRQQSCERCRKMKIKCDHSTPKCGRCRAKNLECIYQVAPMTKWFRSTHFDADSGRVRTTSETQKGEVVAMSDEPLSPLSSGQAIEVPASPAQGDGFLGPGSYRTLIADGQSPQNQSASIGAAVPSVTTHTLGRRKLDLGLQTINFCREYSTLLRNLMNHVARKVRMPVIPHGIILPAVESMCGVVQDDAGADDDAKLRIVLRIFQSSYRPIQSAKITSVDELCQSITGENLRWETIGNVLIMACLCLVHIHDRDFAPLDPNKRSKQELIAQFHKVIDSLMALIDESPVIDELVVCLKYNLLLLAFERFGDSSQHLYTTFMELTSTIYITGIHQVSSAPKEYSEFMHQWRRRCFTAVYAMDKTIATILGRPPLIHRNYCILDPPLDIDDNLIGPALEQEIQKLDQHGWNSDGKHRPTTFIRLRHLLATVREEVLELHLGVNNADTIESSRIVLQKLQTIWEYCPRHMKYSAEMWNGQLSSNNIWFLLCLYIEYLYSKFLVFRTRAQDQSVESLEQLLTTAKEVLSALLVVNEHRERLREVRSDFSGIFLPYGLPCIEVLLVELTQRSSFPSTPGRSRLPRGEIIRELSVYVSCLSWISRPSGGNVETCREVKARLTQILDQIIDPPLNPNALPPNEDMMALVRDTGPRGFGREFLDFSSNLNHLVDWDMSPYCDSRLDMFSQSIM